VISSRRYWTPSPTKVAVTSDFATRFARPVVDRGNGRIDHHGASVCARFQREAAVEHGEAGGNSVCSAGGRNAVAPVESRSHRLMAGQGRCGAPRVRARKFVLERGRQTVDAERIDTSRRRVLSPARCHRVAGKCRPTADASAIDQARSRRGRQRHARQTTAPQEKASASSAVVTGEAGGTPSGGKALDPHSPLGRAKARGLVARMSNTGKILDQAFRPDRQTASIRCSQLSRTISMRPIAEEHFQVGPKRDRPGPTIPKAAATTLVISAASLNRCQIHEG